jgi:plastocyanin
VLPLLIAPGAGAADQSVTATGGDTFSPATVTVSQGESVTWTNGGGVHNVHFDDNSFVEPPFASFDSWAVSRRFTDPGSFRYYCDAHGGPGGAGMAGTVNVTAGTPGASSPSGSGGAGGGSATPVSGQSGAPACVSKRQFKIRLRGLDGVRVRSAQIILSGKQLPVRTEVIDGRRRHTSLIDLRGLPRGSYTIGIVVRTTDGKVLRGTRTYRTCADKLTSAKLPTL